MASTTYISIDVATRSLAIGVYRMKPFQDFDSLKSPNPQEMNENLNSIVVPISMKVYDINDGQKTKDTSTADKAIGLKKVLTDLDGSIIDTIGLQVIVLIEYQMNANHGANAIFNMLMYHYAGRYPIHVMKPSWKNTIALHPSLTLSKFLGTAGSNYRANKNHTRYNMLYLLTMIDRLDLIKGIKAANQDDIADTLMQALAYHKMN